MRTILDMRPSLATEWSERNVLTPNDVSYGSNKKVWWKGKCGHEWEACVKNRSNGAGCPFCAGHKVLKGFNDIATHRPELIREWSEKNAPLRPSDVTCWANITVWWHCSKCGQEWKARVADRMDGHGCPVCAGERLVAGINDLESLYPQLAKEWSYRNKKPASRVWPKSTENVWWICSVCGYEWRRVVDTRVHGSPCPQCERTKLAREAEERKTFRLFLRDSMAIEAIKYYAGMAGLKYVEMDDSIIGIPIELFFPETKWAVKYQRSNPIGAIGIRQERAKNWLCFKSGIRFIRILGPEVDEYDNCICISCEDLSLEAINEAVEMVFKLMRIAVDVDLERDQRDIIHQIS